jgi:small subunit ribosomal protein S21
MGHSILSGFHNRKVSIMSISIEVRGDIEKALRLLKKKMLFEGIQKELRQRRFYEKPSIKKKRKRLEARRRRNKLVGYPKG